MIERKNIKMVWRKRWYVEGDGEMEGIEGKSGEDGKRKNR